MNARVPAGTQAAPQPALVAADPDYQARVRKSFAGQAFMRLIGASIARLEPGVVELAMPGSPELTQQHGFIHGGVVAALLDTACGFAASSLMDAEAGVLTVEFKTNFLSAARGGPLRATGRVRRAGRTVTFVEAEAFAGEGGDAKLVATMQATMICVRGRPDVRH